MGVIRSVHIILLDLIILAISGSPFRSLLQSRVSFPLPSSLNIPFSTISKTFSLDEKFYLLGYEAV
jgi:hypothetical protein